MVTGPRREGRPGLPGQVPGGTQAALHLPMGQELGVGGSHALRNVLNTSLRRVFSPASGQPVCGGLWGLCSVACPVSRGAGGVSHSMCP